MSGRTPRQAVRAFVQPLQRCLALVTDDLLRLSPGGYEPQDAPHVAFLSRTTTPLKGTSPLALSIRIQYRILEVAGQLGPWKVSIAQYDYGLRDGADKEILSFHWHPESRSAVTWPHLHIGTPLLKRGAEIDRRAHIPTSRVSIEAVLRFAIEELGVRARKGYDATLEETRLVFERYRTWA